MWVRRLSARSLLLLAALLSAGLPLANARAQDAPSASAPAADPAVELPPLPPVMPVDPSSYADRSRLAVIGFNMAAESDERDAWLAGAVQEMLCWRLRRHPKLLVVSTERLTQARREMQEEGEPLAWNSVAGALGARWMLTGTVSGNPDAVRVSLELRPISGDAAVLKEELPPARLFAVLDSATRWSLGVLNVPPPDGLLAKQMLDPPCKSPSALEYYIKALAAFREDRARDSARYLRDALDFDSTFRPLLLLNVEVDLRVGTVPARRMAAARLALLFEFCRREEDRLDLCAAEIAHGVLNGIEGGSDAAEGRFARALTIAREAREPYAQIAAMTSLVNLYLSALPPRGAELNDAEREAFSSAKYEKAVAWQQAVITSLEGLDDLVSLAPAANRLAMTYERLGQDEQALALHQRTLQIAQQLHSKRAEATALLLIGQWNMRQKRWDAALTAIQRCHDLTPEAQRPAIATARAAVLRGMGKLPEALAEYEAALERFRKAEDLGNQLLCLREVATLRWDQQRKREAIKAMREAVDVAHALETPLESKLRETLDAWQKEAPAEAARPEPAPAAAAAKPKPEQPAPKKDSPPKKDAKKPK